MILKDLFPALNHKWRHFEENSHKMSRHRWCKASCHSSGRAPFGLHTHTHTQCVKICQEQPEAPQLVTSVLPESPSLGRPLCAPSVPPFPKNPTHSYTHPLSSTQTHTDALTQRQTRLETVRPPLPAQLLPLQETRNKTCWI